MHQNNLVPFPGPRFRPCARDHQTAHARRRQARTQTAASLWQRIKGPLMLMAVGAGIGLEFGLAFSNAWGAGP